MNNYTDLQHPLLVIVRGLPGSGKSYISHLLHEELGEEVVVSLDPDVIDYESQEYKDHVLAQTAEGVDPKLHAYRFLRAKAYQGISDHKIIVWNQPFTNLEIFQKMMERLETHATENHTTLPLLVIEVMTDPKIAQERVVKRKQEGGHGPSEGTFERFVHDYQSFAPEGYNTVSVVGDGHPEEAVSTIVDHITPLLS